MRSYWFFLALFASCILALIHNVASVGYLYWTYRWLDIPVHILGGFALGCFLVAALFRHRLGLYVAGIVVVTVGWEVFEVLIGMPRPTDYLVDTVSDVANGALGAAVAYLFARLSIWRSV